MSELEPRKRRKKAVAPRHIPSEVVPVPPAEARDFVRDALKGTSLRDPFAQLLSLELVFEQRVRYFSVDDAHTRIEFDAVGQLPGADVLMYTRRLGEIDRFFVALHDELDRRARHRRPDDSGGRAVDEGR